MAKDSESACPILISIFNQKGGIGKTTATYEIGYILFKMGLKVLMVDADPQSSLTTIIHPENSSDGRKSELFEEKLQENKKKGIFTRLDDIFEPALAKHQVPVDLQRAESVLPFGVHDYGKEDCKNQKEGLYYLPGSIKFERINKVITLGIENISGTQIYASMVPDFFRELGKINGFDVILIDLNPGIFAINQSIIMKSDYLLMPFKPSLGCLDAVNNLTEIFPSWFDELRRNGHLRKKEGPILLGTFPQIVRIRKVSKSDKEFIEASYQYWIKKIFENTEILVDVFRKYMGDLQPDIKFMNLVDRIGVRDTIGAGLQGQNSGHPLSDLDYKHKIHDSDNQTKPFPPAWKTIKEKTNQSFRKILGIMLHNLTERHRHALTQKNPQFFVNLNLYSNLHEYDKNVPSTKPENSEERPKRKRHRDSVVQDDNRWYTNEDIERLFRAILKDKRGCKYTTPMQGEGTFSKDQLAENISQYLLNEIASDYNPGQGLTIFIPLNVGASDFEGVSGNHWTLVILVMSNNYEGIFYFDPLGKQLPDTIDAALKRVVHDVFRKQVRCIDKLEKRVQFDNYNCGPWIVEFVYQYVQSDDGIAFLPNTNITERRRFYADLLEENQIDAQILAKNQTAASQSKNKRPIFFPSKTDESKPQTSLQTRPKQ